MQKCVETIKSLSFGFTLFKAIASAALSLLCPRTMADNDIHLDIAITSLVEENEEMEAVERSSTDVEVHASNSILPSLFTSQKSPQKRFPDHFQDWNRNTESQTLLSTMRKVSEVIMPPLVPEAVSNDFTQTVTLNQENVVLNSTISPLVPTLNMSSRLVSPTWSPEEIGAVIVVTLMVPFILFSNIFVIVSVTKFRRLRTPTNYFITSLAAVDIFVALATPVMIAVEVFQYGTGSGDVVVCLLPNRMLMMTCGVSLVTLATIAYDRHTAVVNPLEYVKLMTSQKVSIMVTLTWFYSALIVWFPVMIGWYDLPGDSQRCTADLLHHKAHTLFLSAVFLPSFIIIIACNSRLFLVARHHAKAIAAVEVAVHRRLQVRFMIKDMKYAKTLAMVIGVFLILWLPYLLCVFIKTVSDISLGIWLQTYLVLLAVFNSGINPWIYAFKNVEFRAAFKRLMKEYCRSCSTFIPDVRRSSLMTNMSTTPRLSRTDSRMVSTIVEPTLDTISEKIKRSLDSLDELEHQRDNEGCSDTTSGERVENDVLSSSYTEAKVANVSPTAAVEECSKQISTLSRLRDFEDKFHVDYVRPSKEGTPYPSRKSQRLSRSSAAENISLEKEEHSEYSLEHISREYELERQKMSCGDFHTMSKPYLKMYKNDLNNFMHSQSGSGTILDCHLPNNASPSTLSSSLSESCASSTIPLHFASFVPQMTSLESSPVTSPPAQNRLQASGIPSSHFPPPCNLPSSFSQVPPSISSPPLFSFSSSPQHRVPHTSSFCYINESLQNDSRTSHWCQAPKASFRRKSDNSSCVTSKHAAPSGGPISQDALGNLIHTHSCPSFTPGWLMNASAMCSSISEHTSNISLENEIDLPGTCTTKTFTTSQSIRPFC